MCNLTKLTKKKSVIIYKVVYKYVHPDTGEVFYYSLYAGTPVKVGSVIPQDRNIREEVIEVIGISEGDFYDYDDSCMFYNYNHIGRTSGLKLLSDAKALMKDLEDNDDVENVAIIKLQISNSIFIGDCDRFASNIIPENHIIYAGKHIDSLEEVKF